MAMVSNGKPMHKAERLARLPMRPARSACLLALTAATLALGEPGPVRAIDIVREPVVPSGVSPPAKPVAPAVNSTPAAQAAPAPRPAAPATAPVPPAGSPVKPPSAPAAPAGAAGAPKSATAAGPVKLEPKPASLVAQAPRFVVGDTWQYIRTPTDGADRKVTEFRTTLAEVSEREVTTVTGYRMTHSLAALNQTQNNRQTRLFRPHGLSMQFPLAEGKVWSEEYEIFSTEGTQKSVSRIKARARVLRRETVTVPAGAFDALVVQHTLDIELTKGGRETAIRTVWYSPEARAFVRTRYEKRDAKSGAVLESWTMEIKSHSVAR
jgi:hypothetical protein